MNFWAKTFPRHVWCWLDMVYCTIHQLKFYYSCFSSMKKYCCRPIRVDYVKKWWWNFKCNLYWNGRVRTDLFCIVSWKLYINKNSTVLHLINESIRVTGINQFEENNMMQSTSSNPLGWGDVTSTNPIQQLINLFVNLFSLNS